MQLGYVTNPPLREDLEREKTSKDKYFVRLDALPPFHIPPRKVVVAAHCARG